MSYNTIVIVPDLPFKRLIEAIHGRETWFGISGFVPHVHVDPRHDASVRKTAHEVARAERSAVGTRERFAIAMFDHHGCGREQRSDQECETDVERLLASVNFGESGSVCICVKPEFEQWLFVDMEELARVLALTHQQLMGFKELSESRFGDDLEKQFSFILWKRQQLGLRPIALGDVIGSIDFQKWLDDRAFGKLIATLQRWFPLPAQEGLSLR
jgi:hypothetical protein